MALTCGSGAVRRRIGAWPQHCRLRGSPLVSVYAFDPARRHMVVVWPTNVGSCAHVVTPLDVEVSGEDAGLLCAVLSRLSEALWDTYVRPASATTDEQERWRRGHERQEFNGVVAALQKPNLPDEAGMMTASYSPIEESAHRLGRVLHRLANTVLVGAVIADVQIEIDAVTQAELADLSGRAVQAVTLEPTNCSRPIRWAAGCCRPR